MALNSNVLNFSKGENKRFDDAIEAFRNSNCIFSLAESTSLVNAGYDRANLLLGYIYEIGCGELQQNLEYAFFYYTQAVEKVGAVEAWLALGRLYYYGMGTEKDFLKAFECYSFVSQNRNSSIANLMLGKMYHRGLGLDIDYLKAQEQYKLAAASGNVHAIKNLGLLEQQNGHFFKGLKLRITAIIKGFIIAYKNINDPRLRDS